MIGISGFRGRCGRAAAASVLALLVAGSAPGIAGGRVLHKPRVGRVSLLYVVNAASGKLTPQPGHPGRFTLTLRRLERHAVWFSDRPAHRSGAFPSSELATAWKGFGFASTPPNAALDYTDPARGVARTVILELSHPRYDTHRGALSIAARILDPTTITAGNLAAHARHGDRTPAHQLNNPSLFIDDTTAPQIGNCVLQPYTNCSGADLRGADLSNGLLPGANLSYANLTGANLAGASVNGGNLTAANLTNANLTDADLAGVYFIGPPVVEGTNFKGADLAGVYLMNAILADADFADANLSNGNFTNTWFTGDNLSGANLAGANLTEATLQHTNLAASNLTDANANGANFSLETLTDANLSSANFSNANLLLANLLGANITGWTFTGASFCGTRMPWGAYWDSGC